MNVEPGRLEQQLYERRGEWDVCKTCPMRLVCYMKSELRDVRWCVKCYSWVLDNVKIIVRCGGFFIKEHTFAHFVKNAQAAQDSTCPNCNRLDPLFGTYKHINRTIITTQGDPQYLEEKYGKRDFDFANEILLCPSKKKI